MAMNEESLRRLIDAAIRELRTPLVAMRELAALMSERGDSAYSRGRIPRGVEEDLQRIEQVIECLSQVVTLSTPEHEAVDVSELLAELLENERALIRERELLVLKETKVGTMALGDAEQLRFALGLLLAEAVASLPEGGNLYVASSCVSRDPDETGTGRGGGEGRTPRARILLRSSAPGGVDVGLHDAFRVAVAEELVRAQGGTFAVETGAAGEAKVLVELPPA